MLKNALTYVSLEKNNLRNLSRCLESMCLLIWKLLSACDIIPIYRIEH